MCSLIVVLILRDKILNTYINMYIKPSHSTRIIPRSSNTTMQQEIGVIKSERLRALKLSSNKEMEAISINIVKKNYIKKFINL